MVTFCQALFAHVTVIHGWSGGARATVPQILVRTALLQTLESFPVRTTRPHNKHTEPPQP